MREITLHHTNECNKAIVLEAEDRNENGVSQGYYASWLHKDGVQQTVGMPFQYGPIKEVGTNGLTLELHLAICIDQLIGYQSSKYACDENAQALDACVHAMRMLESRTNKRIDRGVEGTHEV